MMSVTKGGRHAAKALKHTGSKEEPLTVEDIRLVADLRIMHSKVDELYQITQVLQQRHNENSIINCADAKVLAEDIRKADELYLWFIRLKDESDRVRKRTAKSG